MKERLRSFLRAIDEAELKLPLRLEDFVGVVLLSVLVLVVTIQVISRYLFKSPIIWTEEVARYMLIIIAFLAAPIAVRNGSNVSLDFIFSKLSKEPRRILSLISELFEIIFYAMGAYLSVNMAIFSKGRYLVSVHIPRTLIFALIAAGFALMLLRAVLRLLQIYCGYTPIACPDMQEKEVDLS